MLGSPVMDLTSGKMKCVAEGPSAAAQGVSAGLTLSCLQDSYSALRIRRRFNAFSSGYT
jgi:hypothetical protein